MKKIIIKIFTFFIVCFFSLTSTLALEKPLNVEIHDEVSKTHAQFIDLLTLESNENQNNDSNIIDINKIGQHDLFVKNEYKYLFEIEPNDYLYNADYIPMEIARPVPLTIL